MLHLKGILLTHPLQQNRTARLTLRNVRQLGPSATWDGRTSLPAQLRNGPVVPQFEHDVPVLQTVAPVPSV